MSERINQAGGKAISVVGDATHETEAEGVAAKSANGLWASRYSREQHGCRHRGFHEVADWQAEMFDEIMTVNTRGPFLISRFLVPKLLEAGMVRCFI